MVLRLVRSLIGENGVVVRHSNHGSEGNGFEGNGFKPGHPLPLPCSPLGVEIYMMFFFFLLLSYIMFFMYSEREIPWNCCAEKISWRVSEFNLQRYMLSWYSHGSKYWVPTVLRLLPQYCTTVNHISCSYGFMEYKNVSLSYTTILSSSTKPIWLLHFLKCLLLY